MNNFCDFYISKGSAQHGRLKRLYKIHGGTTANSLYSNYRYGGKIEFKKFDSCFLPMISCTNFGEMLISMQPMNKNEGHLFYLDFVYNRYKYNYKKKYPRKFYK